MFPAKLTFMNKIRTPVLALTVLLGLLPASAADAQSFAAAGTRAQGMGGAFVGVADDGTAVYWNPAGLAAGSYFSLVVDAGATRVTPDGFLTGADKSNFLIGLSTPALGLGYYRLKAAAVVPPPPLLPIDESLSSRDLSVVAPLRVDTLTTHHAGITLVQSITQGVAIGTTFKLVRGTASSAYVEASTANAALATDLPEGLGQSGSRFDMDIGMMASGGPLKVGVTLRNVREPAFETLEPGIELRLERQARAGLSYAIATNWLAAADVDLLRSRDAFGERRDVAIGVEGRLVPRVYIRSGVSLNTVGDENVKDARALAYSVGGSYAAKASVFIDGHATVGGERTGSGWGIAARFLY